MKTASILSLILSIVLLSSGCNTKKEGGEESSSESAQTVSAGKYCNEKYGFCIQFPSDLLSQDEDADLDKEEGVVFKSENGLAQLRVYHDTRITPVEGEAINLQSLYDEDTAYDGSFDITYKTFATTSYTIQGVRGGQIISYQKTIISNGNIATAILRYAGSEKELFDALIQPIFSSFK